MKKNLQKRSFSVLTVLKLLKIVGIVSTISSFFLTVKYGLKIKKHLKRQDGKIGLSLKIIKKLLKIDIFLKNNLLYKYKIRK